MISPQGLRLCTNRPIGVLSRFVNNPGFATRLTLNARYVSSHRTVNEERDTKDTAEDVMKAEASSVPYPCDVMMSYTVILGVPPTPTSSRTVIGYVSILKVWS
ncbi:hypothetical protein J6590_032288 [Homalodisca vitripennis]|nr:hypothetical protein J6590_032288 [Homalodisca vitripennis]